MEESTQSPQCLTLVDNKMAVCEAIRYHITPVAVQLAKQQVLATAVCGSAVRDVTGGADSMHVAGQLMESVCSRVSESPECFYLFVDALNASNLPRPAGQELEQYCGVCVCVCVCVCVYVYFCVCTCVCVSLMQSQFAFSQRQCMEE